MTNAHFYPIGTPGQPWSDAERARWRAGQQRQRSYHDDVVSALEPLGEYFDVVQYGQLDHAPDHYPLLAVVSRDWNPALPTALVTGGVHGYETSGVHGALQFLADKAPAYAGRINLIVVPCVSPWGYERIQRWNPDAIDPNRSFRGDGLIEEAAALMRWIAVRGDTLLVHLDLHETTNSDLEEFDPARCARDGIALVPDTIPDGFYVIGNSEDPQPAFQQALIAAVEKVTHIAPADANGELVGMPLQSPGVVWGESRSIGACAGFTDARYATTTEVYPDSPRTTPAECNLAQVTAICAGIDFALAQVNATTALQLRLTPPTDDNVVAVARLLQANEARHGGALTGEFPEEKVRAMLDTGSPVISAWDGTALLGVLFTSPAAAAAKVPVLAAMRAAWPGRDDDYLYGPVCIDTAARGQGVLPKLYAALQEQLPGRAAVLFITDDNIASRRAHERLGMHAVASFRWQEALCWVYTDAAT